MAINFDVIFAESDQSFDVVIADEIRIVHDLPSFPGPYEVTPGPSAHVLATSGKAMDRNVIIAAIPNNYGLITYSGFELTVS